MRNTVPIPSKELLNSMFYIEEGKLFRKIRTAQCAKAGTRADKLDKSIGYLKVYVSGVRFLSHRIIFMMSHGWVPDGIDHKDMDKTNNRIENLRPATQSENLRNVATRAKSGIKGVHWHKASGSWSACIGDNGKIIHLGLFKTKDEAHACRLEASKKYHGEFSRIEPRGIS